MTKLEFVKDCIHILDHDVPEEEWEVNVEEWQKHDPTAALLLKDCFVAVNNLAKYLKEHL